MRVLSERSMQALEQARADLADLRARHERMCRRYRALETKHQQLLLELGLRGLVAETKAAVPERVVVRKGRA